MMIMILGAFLVLSGLLPSARAENYQPGTWMLTSRWHQDHPYNYACPLLKCDGSYNYDSAGCTTIAAAQVMRYWAWPPAVEGSPSEGFLWTQMVDEANYDNYEPVAWLIHIVGEEASIIILTKSRKRYGIKGEYYEI